jgi:hypothetical protein
MKKPISFYSKKYPLSIFAVLSLFLGTVNAQTKPTEPTNGAATTATTTPEKYTKPKPTYTATRVLKAPKIDGKLDDAAWQNAPKAVDFVQFEPKPFTKPTNPTEAQLVYDDEAIYISAYIHDDPKNIRKDFSQRDRDIFESNTDYFTCSLDTYNDDQNGFRFVVTPRNIQADARVTPNNADFNWDGVWVSATSIVADGWIVEMKIPYFNLRFPTKTADWGKSIRGRRSTRRLTGRPFNGAI